MMIYDCFSFFNEFELLEIRLNTLNDTVDKFILVEAPWTHTGRKKPLYFAENKDRFSGFLDKIIHIVANDPPVNPEAGERENAWIRENFQRNEISRGLENANPSDIILLSDLDEIPRPEAIVQAVSMPGITRFRLRFYNYYLNYRNYSVPFWPIGTQMCSVATFRDEATYIGIGYDQFVTAEANNGPTMTKLRMTKPARTLKDAGWHFSYCGGIAAIQNKLKSFAHTECNTDMTSDPARIKAALDKGLDPVMRGYRFFREPIDRSFPYYLQKNAPLYREFILPMDVNCGWRTWIPKIITLTGGKIYRAAARCVPPFLVPLALKTRKWIYDRRMRRKNSGRNS